MAVKMIGLDLDGTVLDSKKRISERTREAIMDAAASGITVLPVTGRPFFGIPEELKKIPGISYAVCSNGAVTMDVPGQKVIASHYLDRSIAEKVLDMANAEGVPCCIFAGGYGYMEHDAYVRVLEGSRGKPIYPYLLASRKEMGNRKRFFCGNGKRIENVWIPCRSRQQADILEGEIETVGKLTTLRTVPEDIEIVSPAADKGAALLALAKSLGISREEIMAVGDSVNDLGLLESAGISVAMGNATEEVKAAADIVTADCDRDGCAIVIEGAMGRDENIREVFSFPWVRGSAGTLFYGGSQKWYQTAWRRLAGCASIAAANLACFYEIGIHPAKRQGSLRIYDMAQYQSLMAESYRIFKPGLMGYPDPKLFQKTFLEKAGEEGKYFSSELLSGWKDLSTPIRFAEENIDAGHPLALLILGHEEKEIEENTWHWMVLTGYDRNEKKILVANYGKREWMSAETVFAPGEKNEVTLISFVPVQG